MNPKTNSLLRRPTERLIHGPNRKHDIDNSSSNQQPIGGWSTNTAGPLVTTRRITVIGSPIWQLVRGSRN